MDLHVINWEALYWISVTQDGDSGRLLILRYTADCHKCVEFLLYKQKNVLNIWSEHNYILSHKLVHTTTCFGPVYWPSSGCIINLISSYTICAWVTVGGRDLVLQ